MATMKYNRNVYKPKTKEDKVSLEITKAANGKPSKISKNSILAKAPGTDTVEGNLWGSIGKDEARMYKDQSKVAKRASQIRKNAGSDAAKMYLLGANETTPVMRNQIDAGRTAGQAKEKTGNGNAGLQARKDNAIAKKKTTTKAGAKKKSSKRK